MVTSQNIDTIALITLLVVGTLVAICIALFLQHENKKGDSDGNSSRDKDRP